MALSTLSARDALNIAAQHGFSVRASNWERKMIRDGIIEARQAFARNAVQYFDEKMERVAVEIREDSKTYEVPAGHRR